MSHDDQSPETRFIERRNETFWLHDRDIVLYTVEKTDDGQLYTMFGVRKSVLGFSSEFLEGAFTVSQAPFIHASETYDGLPIMQAFLRAIYNPGYLHGVLERERDPRYGLLHVPESYPRILHIAHKLAAPDDLVQATAKAFLEVWPSDLEEWKRREGALHERVIESSTSHWEADAEEPQAWNVTSQYPDPTSTFAFAREHSPIYDILPVCAYDIVHAQTLHIPSSGHGFRRFDWSLLNEQDALNIRRGGEAIRADCAQKLDFDCFRDLMLPFCQTRCRRSPRDSSVQDLQCLVGLQSFWEKQVAPLLSPARPIDFLNLPVSCSTDAICVSCASAVAKHIKNAQYVMWAKLPEYFCLVSIRPH
ncbi:hypothetical protein PENSPDRAFT_688656 [Peniophora sp. CONT]|nr:hypothetical protein PENSPDRAFT_688656 [Peniophora sp. CONT]